MLISLTTTTCSSIFVMFSYGCDHPLFTQEERDLLALLTQGKLHASTYGLVLVNRRWKPCTATMWGVTCWPTVLPSTARSCR